MTVSVAAKEVSTSSWRSCHPRRTRTRSSSSPLAHRRVSAADKEGHRQKRIDHPRVRRTQASVSLWVSATPTTECSTCSMYLAGGDGIPQGSCIAYVSRCRGLGLQRDSGPIRNDRRADGPGAPKGHRRSMNFTISHDKTTRATGDQLKSFAAQSSSDLPSGKFGQGSRLPLERLCAVAAAGFTILAGRNVGPFAPAPRQFRCHARPAGKTCLRALGADFRQGWTTVVLVSWMASQSLGGRDGPLP